MVVTEKWRSSCRWLAQQRMDHINNITKRLKLKIVLVLLASFTIKLRLKIWTSCSGWNFSSKTDTFITSDGPCWPLKSACLILQFKEFCFASHYEVVFCRLFSCLSMDFKKKKKKENADSTACCASGCRIRPLWQIPLVSKCNLTTKAHCRTAEFWQCRVLPALSRLRELVCVFDDFLIPFISIRML